MSERLHRTNTRESMATRAERDAAEGRDKTRCVVSVRLMWSFKAGAATFCGAVKTVLPAHLLESVFCDACFTGPKKLYTELSAIATRVLASQAQMNPRAE